MSQIFGPRSNTVSRIVLWSAAILPWIAIYVGMTYSRSPYNTKVHVALDQPIPFSHKHHVDQLGIDCRFCHTSVEKSSFAGFPTTQVCMTCHSQIWTNSPLLEPLRESFEKNIPLKWNKVNTLPDFVYFNHSIHISRGVHCNNCHGPMQNMHLTSKGNDFQMRWCLNCHRETEKFLYQDVTAYEQGKTPRQQVFDLYLKSQARLPLTPREHALLTGDTYKANNREIDQGKKLIKEYGINKDQLEDCTICHH